MNDWTKRELQQLIDRITSHERPVVDEDDHEGRYRVAELGGSFREDSSLQSVIRFVHHVLDEKRATSGELRRRIRWMVRDIAEWAHVANMADVDERVVEEPDRDDWDHEWREFFEAVQLVTADRLRDHLSVVLGDLSDRTGDARFLALVPEGEGDAYADDRTRSARDAFRREWAHLFTLHFAPPVVVEEPKVPGPPGESWQRRLMSDDDP